MYNVFTFTVRANIQYIIDGLGYCTVSTARANPQSHGDDESSCFVVPLPQEHMYSVMLMVTVTVLYIVTTTVDKFTM